MILRNPALVCSMCLLGAHAATVGDTDRFIPLIHDGGGWSTQITIVNLSDKPATVSADYATAKANTDQWKVELKATQGKVCKSSFEVSLAPGALAVVETSGAPTELTRGFAEIVERDGKPIGAFARLIRKDNGQVVQSFTVPLSPANESRSVVSLDLSDPSASVEMAWVSHTNSTLLDVTFRKDTGEIVLADKVSFNGLTQIFYKPQDVWPQLAGFRGTLEWKVSFPMADRYEYRFLSGVSILARSGQAWAAVPALTLKADQLDVRPY